MYITEIPNRNSPPAVLLRESYREGGKVKTRTLANLTHLSPQRLAALKKAFKGEFDEAETVSTSPPAIGEAFGGVFVLKQLSDQLGITKALGKSEEAKQVLLLVLARICHQGSRLSAVRWSKGQAIDDVLGLSDVNENELYAALDWVSKKQKQIEHSLYKNYIRQHGKPPMLVLYDVTSSYFEGEKNELSAYGYNRDKKKGKKQIVIGLLAAEDGEPLCVRVFEGNTSDPKTLYEQIRTLKENWNIKDVVLIGDKGMIKTPGKQAITQEGWHYITALSKPEIRKLLLNQRMQMSLFDEELYEIEMNGKRYVLRKNPIIRDRLRRERSKREAKLKKAVDARNEYVKAHQRAHPEKGLAKLQALAKTYRIDGYIDLTLEDGQVQFKKSDQSMESQFSLDGCYMIESTVPTSMMSTQDIEKCYRSLSQVEQDFRLIKTSSLEVRPIFLRKANRTKAHVFIAMLALKLLRALRSKMNKVYGTTQEDRYAPTIKEALEAMDTLRFLHYTVGDQLVTRLSKPNDNVRKILMALNIKLPKQKQRAKTNVGRRNARRKK